MYEKILLKLKEQRGTTSNVSDRSLEDMARSFEAVISTDELLTKADFSRAIETIDGNINKYTAGAITKLKEKQIEDKKKQTPPPIKKVEGVEDKKTDEKPEWAEALMESNKLMSEQLASFKSDKVKTGRKEKLNNVLKDMPDFYKKPIIQSFEKTSFDSDEEYDTYVSEIKTSSESFQQAAKEQGLLTMIPKKDVKQPEETGETPALSNARDLVNKAKEKK